MMYKNPQHLHGCDKGPHPYALNIERATLDNENFRTAMWTGENLQMTTMKICPGGEIGLEMHPSTDQFVRIESGCGIVMMGEDKNCLTYKQNVCDGWAFFVPAGHWHNLVNTGRKPIKLYSIYAPPNHPQGTVHHTPKDAEHEHD